MAPDSSRAQPRVTDRTVGLDERKAALSRVPAFATLPRQVLETLATKLRQEQAAAGTAVVVAAEVGDRMYLIVEGQAEVSIAGDEGPIVVATLHPGEYFGEMALLGPTHLRAATVTATTPLLLLSLFASTFHEILTSYPRAAQFFQEAAETNLRHQFLKRTTPFKLIATERLHEMAARLETREVEAGQTLIRQGDRGDACYLVRRGRVEVVVAQELGIERSLATLGPGMLFGETALLTDAPRTATVRTIEPTELLVLQRAVLLEALSEDRRFGAEVAQLVQARGRPRRRPSVVVEERPTDDGETISTLKDTARNAYHQLPPEGCFLWDRLDGRRTVADLAQECAAAFHFASPQPAGELLEALARAGFVEMPTVRSGLFQNLLRGPLGERAISQPNRIVGWLMGRRS